MEDDELSLWTPDELAALRQLWDDQQQMYAPFDEPKPFEYDEPLPEQAGNAIGGFLVDAAKHPAATTAEALMWLPQMNVGKWGLKGLAGQLGLELGGTLDMLRDGDEQAARFVDNMVRNPGDWYHLIRGATGGTDGADPETLHKTFDTERP